MSQGLSVLERSISQGLQTLTLARPERGNALSEELVEELLSAIHEAFADLKIHTLLICGQSRHLSTGFDNSNLEQQSDGDLLRRFVRIEQMLAALWHAPIRTVGIATGSTWGAGADLFATCDIRLAAPDVTFKFPGAAFGLALGTRRLSERVGADRARAWLLSGAQIDAQEAYAAGLVTAIVQPSDLESWLSAHILAPAVEREAVGRIHRATRTDHDDRDLAHLVRSAAPAGLRDRIAAYVGRSQPARGRR